MILEALSGAAAAARRLGASDVEVSHTARTLGVSRFANSTLTQSGVIEERLTRVRVADGERIGAATTSSLDGAALAAAAAQALEAARRSPVAAGFTGFARPDPARPTRAVRAPVDATAAFGPAARAELLGRCFRRAAADHLLLAGSFHTGPRRRAVVTAGGVARLHESTEAQLSIIALDGEASGHAVGFSPDVARLDADRLADEACAGAARARGAAEREPGAYDVVLAPAAVAELLEWMDIGSFSARSVLDGLSFLAGAAGKELVDPRLTVVDDAGFDHPDAAPCPFDDEGTARSRVALIDAGRAGPPLSDLATAAQLGGASTGHAAPIGSDLVEGPAAGGLVLLPGADSRSELVGRVERGLFVTRFHYVNGLLDTRRAVMTGMTRDGLFEIRDGTIGKPVKNLRFTESILEAFRRVGGIGKDLQAIPGSWTSASALLCPALLLRGFTFTGQGKSR